MAWWLPTVYLVLSVIPLPQTQPTSPPQILLPFSNSSSHCGYRDPALHVVIEPRFGICFPFSEGLALVQERGKLWDMQSFLDIDLSPTNWGYIDATGNYVLKFKPRDYLPGGSFTEGLAPIYDAKAKKYGYIN